MKQNLKEQDKLISVILQLENKFTSHIINNRGTYKSSKGDEFQEIRDELKQLRLKLNELKRSFKSLEN